MRTPPRGRAFSPRRVTAVVLLAINQGTRRTEFTYGGLHRRTRIVEKDSGTVVSDRRYLWAGMQIAEERDANGP